MAASCDSDAVSALGQNLTSVSSDLESNSSCNVEETRLNVKHSEFIRNLPGLPSHLNMRLDDQVVSCVAASGPLEDNSEQLPCTVKPERLEETVVLVTSSDVVIQTDAATNVKLEGTEEKSKDRHSRHRSSRDCRKCNDRRKIKRCNVGVQCKIEKRLGKTIVPQVSFTRSMHTSNFIPNWEIHKYASLIHLETYPNGNASLLHMYQEEIDKLNLTEKESIELAEEFLKVCYYLFTIPTLCLVITNKHYFPFSYHLVKMIMDVPIM